MSEFIKNESGKADIISTIEGEKWQNAKEHAFNKLAKNVAIKGFRKGQAPKNLLKKYISDGEVLLNACEDLAQEALISAIDEHKVDLIARPELKIDEINEDKCVMRFSCQIKPDVNLGEYKGLGFKVEDVEVSKEEIDEEINRLLERKADLELKEDGEVEDGDTAVIDYEGFVDNVAFAGGKDENYELEIGSNTFIPGFEEQIIGMKVNEEKDIFVKFPDNYTEELKGKDAVFKVKVNDIKEKVERKFDKELFEDLAIDGIDSKEKLEKYVEQEILTRKEMDNENKYVDELLETVSKNVDVDIPEEMVEEEINRMISRYDEQLKMQGMSIDMYYQFTNQTEKDLRNQMEKEAYNHVLYRLMLEELIEIEKVDIKDEEVSKEIEEASKKYKMKKEDFIKSFGGKEMIKYDLEIRKVIELLKEYNK